MLLMTIWVAKLLLFHPFHVSVCDMVYDSRQQNLEISVRIFLDDLEKGLQGYTQNPSFFLQEGIDTAYLNQSLEGYINQKLIILNLKGDTLSYKYWGFEEDLDVMWCYFEVFDLSAFEGLEIRNEILLEVYDDQENLVHLRNDGDVKSARMYEKNTVSRISWQADD
jgi:hypothetical protein